MTRILSLLAVLLLAALLVWMPEVPPDRLAAQDASRVLAESPELAEAVLSSGDVETLPGGDLRLRLGGVRLVSASAPGAAPESAESAGPAAGAGLELATGISVHGLARRSLVLGLRQYAASTAGKDGRSGALEVRGEEAPRGQGGASFLVTWSEQRLGVRYTPEGGAPVSAEIDWHPPDRWSLAPPLVAILLAILFRRPVLALFLGVISGAWLARWGAGQAPLEALAAATGFVPPSLRAAPSDVTFGGLFALLPEAVRAPLAELCVRLPDWITRYLWPQVAREDRTFTILFVVFMLAMVGIVTRAGGVRGMMDAVARVARTVRSTQLAAWLMGLVVFFDDYANTILVGSTMRPLTDRFRVSREKLAYIVDSTAAPVAGLSIFSTWIAFEVSTFSAQLPAAGLTPSDGYAVFIETLPFRFYSILTLVFVALVALLGRDFGPMLTAERRARATGQVVRPGGRPMVGAEATDLEPYPGVVPRAASAVYPVLTFLGLTLIEILRAGGAFRSSFSDCVTYWAQAARGGGFLEAATGVLYEGSGTRPLAIGSAAGLFVALAIAHSQGLRAVGEIARAAWTTLRALGIAIVILYLAWMIGAVCVNLSTATYLTALVGQRLIPHLLPAILLVTSAVVAFSTGSSWSTMSILLPLVVGLAFTLGESQPDLGGHVLLVLSIGAVLEGAIFGDHCSPISDTTVLSSTSSASDHIDHVRTQAPYALLTMLVALLAGYLPCAFFAGRWSAWLGLGTGVAVLALVLLVFGRPVAAPARPDSSAGLDPAERQPRPGVSGGSDSDTPPALPADPPSA